MAKQGKYFPSQDKEEKVFLLIRKHWFNYVIFFFLDLMGFIPIAGYFYYLVANPDFIQTDSGIILFLILSIFVLLLLAVQLYGFVDYYLDVYIVTDQRIVDISQDGFFKRQISELHLHQVQDVNASIEGFWGTLLHFGDVHIQTAGEREMFIFKAIPHPYTIAKQIVELHENHMEKNFRTNKKKDLIQVIGAFEDEALPYGKMGAKKESDSIQVTASDSSKTVNKKDKMKTKSLADKAKVDYTPATLAEEGELKEGREIDLR